MNMRKITKNISRLLVLVFLIAGMTVLLPEVATVEHVHDFGMDIDAAGTNVAAGKKVRTSTYYYDSWASYGSGIASGDTWYTNTKINDGVLPTHCPSYPNRDSTTAASEWHYIHNSSVNVARSFYIDVDLGANYSIASGKDTGARIYMSLGTSLNGSGVYGHWTLYNSTSYSTLQYNHLTSIRVDYGTTAGGSERGTAKDIKGSYYQSSNTHGNSVTDCKSFFQFYDTTARSNVRYIRFTISYTADANTSNSYYNVFVGEVAANTSLPAPTISISNLVNTNLSYYGAYAICEAPTISWSAVSGATSYDVYYNGTIYGNTTSTSITLSNTSTYRLYDRPADVAGVRLYDTCYVVAKNSTASSGSSNTLNYMYVNKPTDRNGNPVMSADVIIDAGHGGSEPGAQYYGRRECDDNLNLALKVGKYLEDAGYSVAYTRLTDVFDSKFTKGAMVRSGNYRVFLCIHRNAYNTNWNENSDTNGVEYWSYTTNSGASYAAKLREAVNEDGYFTDRGLKSDAYVMIASQDVIPSVMAEMSYVSNTGDNTKFDTYFNETAQSLARGTIRYLGQTVGYEGKIELPQTANITNNSVTLSETVEVTNAPDAFVNVKGYMMHTYGISKLQYKIDGGSLTDMALLNRSDLSSHTTYSVSYGSSGFNENISTSGLSGGSHTIELYATTKWETTRKYTSNTYKFATVNINVTNAEYTVNFYNDTIFLGTVTARLDDAVPAVPSDVQSAISGTSDKRFEGFWTKNPFSSAYQQNTSSPASTNYRSGAMVYGSDFSSNIGSTWIIVSNSSTIDLYVSWEYKIELRQNDSSGSTLSSLNGQNVYVWVAYNDIMPTLSSSQIPARTGYTFKGYSWSGADGSYYYNGSGTVTDVEYPRWNGSTYGAGHQYLYAHWQKNTYSVTLSAPGAGNSYTAEVTAEFDSEMPEIAILPTKTGYIFDGYFDTDAAEGGNQYYTAGGASMRSWDEANNTTLYARWALKTYTINFYRSTSSSAKTLLGSTTATYLGSVPDVPPEVQTAVNTADSGAADMMFEGFWNADPHNDTYQNGSSAEAASANYRSKTMVYDDQYASNIGDTWNVDADGTTIDLYLSWKYRIELRQNDDTDTQSSLRGEDVCVWVAYNDIMPTLTSSQIPTRTRYNFAGYTWSGTNSSKFYQASGEPGTGFYRWSGNEYESNDHRYLSAYWTPWTYTVHFDKNGGLSTVTGTMADQTFTYMTAQVLTSNAFSVPNDKNGTAYSTKDISRAPLFVGWALEPDSLTADFTNGESNDGAKLVDHLTANNCTVTLYAIWGNQFFTRSFLNTGYNNSSKCGTFNITISGNYYKNLTKSHDDNDPEGKYHHAYVNSGDVTGRLTNGTHVTLTDLAVDRSGYSPNNYKLVGYYVDYCRYYDGNNGTNSGLTREMIEASPDYHRITGDGPYTVEFDIDGVTEIMLIYDTVYSVTYSLGDGVLPDGYSNPVRVAWSEPIPLPAPVKTGYGFDNWKDGSTVINSSNNTKRSATAGGSVTLTANYHAYVYTIRYNKNLPDDPADTHVEPYTQTGVTYGVDTALTANRFALNGATFMGWAKEEHKDEPVIDFPTNNLWVRTKLTPTCDNDVIDVYAKWNCFLLAEAFENKSYSYGTWKGTYEASASPACTVFKNNAAPSGTIICGMKITIILIKQTISKVNFLIIPRSRSTISRPEMPATPTGQDWRSSRIRLQTQQAGKCTDVTRSTTGTAR